MKNSKAMLPQIEPGNAAGLNGVFYPFVAAWKRSYNLLVLVLAKAFIEMLGSLQKWACSDRLCFDICCFDICHMSMIIYTFNIPPSYSLFLG